MPSENRMFTFLLWGMLAIVLVGVSAAYVVSEATNESVTISKSSSFNKYMNSIQRKRRASQII